MFAIIWHIFIPTPVFLTHNTLTTLTNNKNNKKI